MIDGIEVQCATIMPGSAGSTPSQVRSIRYEDIQPDGSSIPPLPVYTMGSPTRRSSAASFTRRPRTSPNTRAAALSSEVKRDSGIAPSISGCTAGRASDAESHQSSAAGGAAREPSLPTIVVHDEEPAETMDRSRGSFRRRKSKATCRAESPPGLQRIRSFHGIQTDIPSSGLNGIELHDLTSDKMEFSQRGSLMFGGKKMNELIAAQNHGVGHDQPQITPMSITEGLYQLDEGMMSTATSQADLVSEEPVAPLRLVAGRRQPSVHMLQAALEDGRVLSAEDITFSMKIRSMYQHGDERAAEWVHHERDGNSARLTPESSHPGSPTPTGDRASEADQSRLSTKHSLLSPSPRHPSSRLPRSQSDTSLIKDAYELAGGIEDWENVNGMDVDRYGFISPNRVTSNTSSNTAGPIEPLQRVATSLRVDSGTPRRERNRLTRGLSNARSSRSVQVCSSRDEPAKGNESLRSFNSGTTTRSSTHPFQSKDHRTLAEAADMLYTPPGLAAITEQEDTGKAASLLRRRDRQREEKWQKMARVVPGKGTGQGGGMRFDIDSTDPKVASRAWKGIPDRWRATAWHCFLTASAERRGQHTSDEELIAQFHKMQEMSSADDMQIDVDVPRTISMHIMFRRRYRGGQRLLFRVLHAISLYCPDTGYVQGMASLAATLLCYYDEEQAFVMLVRLWKLRGLEQLFQSGFEGLFAALSDFEKNWLCGGDVAQKLEELGISSTAYGTRWYLTLFNMSVPFAAQLRVWDVFMLLGDAAPSNGSTNASPSAQQYGGADLDVLHATSAALIDATRAILLDSDFENAMKVLTSFVPVRDEDLLMRVARTEWKMRKKRAGVKA